MDDVALSAHPGKKGFHQRKGIKFPQQVIGMVRVLDLLNFPLRSDYHLAADYAFDFVQRKRVGLNRQ